MLLFEASISLVLTRKPDQDGGPPVFEERLVQPGQGGDHWRLSHDIPVLKRLGHRLPPSTRQVKRFEGEEWVSRSYHDEVSFATCHFVFYKLGHVQDTPHFLAIEAAYRHWYHYFMM